MRVNIAEYAKMLLKQGRALARSNGTTLQRVPISSGQNAYVLETADAVAQLDCHANAVSSATITRQQASTWLGHAIVLFRDARDFFRTLDGDVFRGAEFPFNIGIHVSEVVQGRGGAAVLTLSTGALDSILGWGVATHELVHSLQYESWNNARTIYDEHGNAWSDSESPLHILDEALPKFFEASRRDATSYSIPRQDPVVSVSRHSYAEYLSAGAYNAAAALNGLLWGVREFLMETRGEEEGLHEMHRLAFMAMAIFGEASIEERFTHEGNARIFITGIERLLARENPEVLPRFLDDCTALGYARLTG